MLLYNEGVKLGRRVLGKKKSRKEVAHRFGKRNQARGRRKFIVLVRGEDVDFKPRKKRQLTIFTRPEGEKVGLALPGSGKGENTRGG